MANWLNLEGKVVAVTGGASGIGKHIASTLVAAGANTVVIDMNTKTGEVVDGAYQVQCNVTDPESVKAMMDEIIGKYETPGVGGKEAIEDGTFKAQIEAAQNSEIEGVAGATMTSGGVRKAVEDVLKQALNLN